jgi:histidine triad (HIT) family protein
MISGALKVEAVLQTPDAFVIRDIAPQAPHHYLVLSRTHVDSLNDASPEMVAALYEAAVTVARHEGFDRDGYRTVINVLERGGQTIRHLHLLGGRDLTWPPG